MHSILIPKKFIERSFLCKAKLWKGQFFINCNLFLFFSQFNNLNFCKATHYSNFNFVKEPVLVIKNFVKGPVLEMRTLWRGIKKTNFYLNRSLHLCEIMQLCMSISVNAKNLWYTKKSNWNLIHKCLLKDNLYKTKLCKGQFSWILIFF